MNNSQIFFSFSFYFFFFFYFLSFFLFQFRNLPQNGLVGTIPSDIGGVSLLTGLFVFSFFILFSFFFSFFLFLFFFFFFFFFKKNSIFLSLLFLFLFFLADIFILIHWMELFPQKLETYLNWKQCIFFVFFFVFLI